MKSKIAKGFTGNEKVIAELGSILAKNFSIDSNTEICVWRNEGFFSDSYGFNFQKRGYFSLGQKYEGLYSGNSDETNPEHICQLVAIVR